MSNASDLELQLLGLINAERDAIGLDPLRLVTPLNAASEDHSRWMLETDIFSHMGAGGSSPYARMTEAGYPFEGASMALENIGWQSARGEPGFADDVEDIHESLMQSPGHRANILNPDAEDMGLGVEIGTFSAPSGDFESVMVTQVFASTEADVTDLVDPGTGPADDGPVPVDDDPADDPIPVDPIDEVPTGELEPEEPTDAPDPMAEDGPRPVPEQDLPEEEQPEETPAEDPMETPGDMPDIALPCGLEAFTVDLSGAFEFRQEGDQLIWETSEDKLIAAFLAAFEDWTMQPPEDGPDVVEVFDDEEDDLLPDAQPEDWCMAPEDDEIDDEVFADMCV